MEVEEWGGESISIAEYRLEIMLTRKGTQKRNCHCVRKFYDNSMEEDNTLKAQVSKAKLKQLLNTGRNKKKSLVFALKREGQRGKEGVRKRRGAQLVLLSG